MKSRVSACKHDSGLARVHSQRINPFASMPAAKSIASAAGLIQAIQGAREPLLVAYTLMDNASMQRKAPAQGVGRFYQSDFELGPFACTETRRDYAHPEHIPRFVRARAPSC